MTHRQQLLAFLVLSSLGTLACGDAQDLGSSAASEEGAENLPLTIGARGDIVRRSYELLRRSGYFPNPALEEAWPGFTALAPEPADPERFGTELETALRKYQINMGLEANGTLDEATWASLQKPRCGVPDRDPERDASSSQKWALLFETPPWNRGIGTTLRYYVDFSGCGGTPCFVDRPNWDDGEILDEIEDGVEKWNPWIDLVLDRTTSSSSADFRIVFRDLGAGNEGFPAWARPPEPGQPPLFEFNRNATAWASESLQYVEDVAAHEMGHMLGIEHSSVSTVQMHPSDGQSSLRHDDKLAGNMLYNVFGISRDCCGIDMDANSTPSGGDKLWLLSQNGRPYEWTASGWASRSGVTGTKIAVCSDNVAYVVRTNGIVSRFDGVSWASQPALPSGTATAIGCSERGTTVWVLGTGNKVWKRTTTGWLERTGMTNAKEIDVDSTGTPWVITTNEQVWRHSSGSTWTRMDTNSDPGRLDIGIGASVDSETNSTVNEYVWVISDTNGVSVLNQQTAVPGAPVRDLFQTTGRQQFGTRITAGRGSPYIVDESQELWKRSELPF